MSKLPRFSECSQNTKLGDQGFRYEREEFIAFSANI